MLIVQITHFVLRVPVVYMNEDVCRSEGNRTLPRQDFNVIWLGQTIF